MSKQELKNLEQQLENEIQIMKTFNPFSLKLNDLIEMKQKVSTELDRLETVTIAVEQLSGRMRFAAI
jgi:hypothetical protein